MRCCLKFNGGIAVHPEYSLTIWAQSTNKDTVGKLIATGDNKNAGIGGENGGVQAVKDGTYQFSALSR